MFNFGLKAIAGPYKKRGYMMCEGSHKTMPENDYFYVRFKDEKLIIVQRKGTVHLGARTLERGSK